MKRMVQRCNMIIILNLLQRLIKPLSMKIDPQVISSLFAHLVSRTPRQQRPRHDGVAASRLHQLQAAQAGQCGPPPPAPDALLALRQVSVDAVPGDGNNAVAGVVDAESFVGASWRTSGRRQPSCSQTTAATAAATATATTATTTFETHENPREDL